MPRERDPRRNQALRLWLESKKKRTLVDIAAELGVSDSLIRKWKYVDHWDKATLRLIDGETRVIVPQPRGAPKGNKNASGCGAPRGNKNALKTGEFESIFFDSLDSTEQDMIGAVTLDKKSIILHEIQLLTVRERRMMKRLEMYKERANQTAEVRTSFVVGNIGQTVKTKAIADLILTTEEGLTRIQSQKRQVVELLHKIDKAELEVF